MSTETYREGDIKLNPATGQVEVLTPEGIWSAQALEQQVGFIQSEVQRLSKEATILDTSRLREEVIPGMKKKLMDLTGEKQQVEAGQPVETITLYKNNQTAQVPAFDVANWVKKGWGGTQPTADGVGKDEKAAFGIEDTEDAQAKQLQTDIDKIDTQVETYQTSLSGLLTSMTDQTAELVKSIQQQYEVRRQQLKRITQSQTASYQTLMTRIGGTRYAPDIAEGVVSEIEQQGIMKLADLDADERSAIATAKSALTNKQFDIAKEQVDKAISLRDKKQTQLNELNKEARKRNAEITDKQKLIDRDIAIGKLVDAKITDPYDIQSALENAGFSATIEDIDKVLDAAKQEEKITDAKRVSDIETFFQDKYLAGKITAQDYIQAQRDWVASGGNTTDFKSAFPVESLLEEKELAKLPSAIFKLEKPEKPEKPTETEKSQSAKKDMSFQLKQVVGDDGYISPDNWRTAKQAWVDTGLTPESFIQQFYGLINPAHPKDYGTREESYVSPKAGTNVIITPEAIQAAIKGE